MQRTARVLISLPNYSRTFPHVTCIETGLLKKSVNRSFPEAFVGLKGPRLLSWKRRLKNEKKLSILIFALVLVIGTGNFAFARHEGHGYGVKHGFYKAKKHKHYRPFHRFNRRVLHRHQPIVVVKEQYIPYSEPASSGGTELDFGSIILRLPEVVVFE